MAGSLEALRICETLNNLMARGRCALCSVVHSGEKALDLAVCKFLPEFVAPRSDMVFDFIMLVRQGIYLGPMGAVVKGPLPRFSPGTLLVVSSEFPSVTFPGPIVEEGMPVLRISGEPASVAMDLSRRTGRPPVFRRLPPEKLACDLKAAEEALNKLTESFRVGLDGPGSGKTGFPSAAQRTAGFLDAFGCRVSGRNRVPAEELAKWAFSVAGLGPGLTPAGDDLLIGMMLCGRALEGMAFEDAPGIGRVCETCADLSALAPALAGRTSWLSGKLLDAAGTGCFSEPLLEVGEAIASLVTGVPGLENSNRADLVEKIFRLRDFGHSSGLASATGALWAFSLALGGAESLEELFRMALGAVFNG